MKIKDSNQEVIKKEIDQESEGENQGREIIGIMIKSTNKSNNGETYGCKYMKDLKSSFQVLGYPSDRVHCNACPEFLRGGSDNREEYFPTVSTSGSDSAGIRQNLNHNIKSSAKKKRIAAGRTLLEENDNSGFKESYLSSSIIPSQPDYKERTNNCSHYSHDYRMYQDSNHHTMFSDDTKVSQRSVTPMKQNYYQSTIKRCTGRGGEGLPNCTRKLSCSNGKVDLEDHSTNTCTLVKDLNCRMHNMCSALCCSVAENIDNKRDNINQQFYIEDNCEQNNVNQMEFLLLDQRAVPCWCIPVTDELFSQNLRQQCLHQSPTVCGEIDDISFQRHLLPLHCIRFVTDCSPNKIFRFESGKDDLTGEEKYSQRKKHQSLGCCGTERKESEEQHLMRRSGSPEKLPSPIKCIQLCDSCSPPAGNFALKSQQPTEFLGNWDCKFNSEENFGHQQQVYKVDQGYFNEVNDYQEEYKRTSRPCGYGCLQQSLCHLQSLDHCAGKDCGDVEYFQHSKTRNMSRRACGTRQINETGRRHDRKLYVTRVKIDSYGPESLFQNHIPAGKNERLNQVNLEYTHFRIAKSVNEGQIVQIQNECYNEQIQQVLSYKVAAGDDVCIACKRLSDIFVKYTQLVDTRSIIPEKKIDFLEHKQKEYSENIPISNCAYPNSIPRDTNILGISKMHFSNTGSQNTESVTTVLPERDYLFSTISSKKIVSPSGNRGDGDYLQYFVVQSEDKNEGRAVVVVEKENGDLVQFINPGYDERYLQQQLIKIRFGDSGWPLNPTLTSHNSYEMLNESIPKNDYIKNRLDEPEKDFHQDSNRHTANKNELGNLDFQQRNVFESISTESKCSQKIGPNKRQTTSTNSIQTPNNSPILNNSVHEGCELFNVSEMSKLSGERFLTEEELNLFLGNAMVSTQSNPCLPTRVQLSDGSSHSLNSYLPYPNKYDKYLGNDIFPQCCNIKSPKCTEYYDNSLISKDSLIFTMDNKTAQQSYYRNQKQDHCTTGLRSGIDNVWKYNFSKSYNNDLRYANDKMSIDSFSEIDSCPSASKSRNIYRLRAGMDQSNQIFSQKFIYHFGDKNICNNYNIVEMGTLEDLKPIANPKLPQLLQLPQPQFQHLRPSRSTQATYATSGTNATYRIRAGMDSSGHSIKSNQNDSSSNYAESDSRRSEISGLLKQEIKRLRKINEEALAMISAHRYSTQKSLSKQPLLCENGRTMSNVCNGQSSSTGVKNLQPYISSLVDDCASNVDESVRKKIIEGVLGFVRFNSDWLKLNFSKDTDAESSRPPSKAVNFEVSGIFNLALKDTEGPTEQEMTITSMQILPGCDTEPLSPQKKEPEESETAKEEEE